jgi:hypothetical protein
MHFFAFFCICCVIVFAFLVCFLCIICIFLCVHFFFAFSVRGVLQENSLMYAMYVYAGYVHRAAVRWRANVHVFSNAVSSGIALWAT